MKKLKDGWKCYSLGDLFEFKNGLNADKSQYGQGHKFVNVMDIFNNDILTEEKILGKVLVNEKQLSEYELKFGDVLFNRTSEVPEEIAFSTVYLDKASVVFGGFVIRARPKTDKLAPEYLIYLFQGSDFRNQAIKCGQGAIRANIGQKDLAKIKINVPPLEEQTQIAETLSTWDSAIQTTEELLENSRRQKKALMQRLLSGENWKEVKLIDIGKVITGNTPPKSDSCNYGNEICWATADDFNNKYIRNTKIKLSKIGANKARIVPKGSILVTCIASIGKNAIADIDLATNQQINSIIVNSNMNNEFIYYLIENNKHKLFSLAGTTAVPIVNKTTFEKMKFIVPALNEQQKIAEILSTADQEIETLQRKLECLKLEKWALMQRLL